jgi:hypothetical protein
VFFKGSFNITKALNKVLLLLTIYKRNTNLNCRIYASRADEVKKRPTVRVTLICTIEH